MTIDPEWETGDADINNNAFPRKILPSRIEAYKSSSSFSFKRRDIMHDSTTELDTDEEEGEEDEAEEAVEE